MNETMKHAWAALQESGGYRLVLWQFGVACVLCVAWLHALGSAVWSALWRKAQGRPELPGLLRCFFVQVLGMACAVLIALVLALFGQLHAVGVAVVSVLIVGWHGAQTWRDRTLASSHMSTQAGVHAADNGSASALRVSAWEWAVLGIATLTVIMEVWRFPGHWDDVSYHLPMARSFLESHSLAANEWLRFPYFPAYGQLLLSLGLMVDVPLAQWLANWPEIVTLLGLMGLSRWRLGHSGWGVMAWFLYSQTPLVETISGYAYLDMMLALYTTAMVCAAVAWLQAPAQHKMRWLCLAGGLAGIAGGMKLHGLVIAALVGISMALLSGSVRNAVRTLWVYGLVCAGVCGFWYVRSYAMTGDPVHPAGGNVFGHYLWSAQDLANQMLEQARHGVPKQWRFFVSAFERLEVAFVLLGLLAPVLRIGRERAWLMVWLVGAMLVMFWFWVSQVDRYLMPALPLLALLGALPVWTAVQIVQRRLPHSAGAWFTAACGLAALSALGINSLNDWRDWRSRTPIAQQSARPEVALLAQADTLKAAYGERVLNLGYENAFFYYSGQLIGDWQGAASFFKMIDCNANLSVCVPNGDKIVPLMHETRTRILLVNAQQWKVEGLQHDPRFEQVLRTGTGVLFVLK